MWHSAVRALRALVLLALTATAGCTALGGTERGDPEVEAYPAWLIAAGEPVAPVVGLAISAVVWRGGYLRGHDDAIALIQHRLRPLDIILFSSKGRLSGRTGGGLFGHAAVYLGTERELREAGLWSDPAIAPYQADIRAGKTLVESAQPHGTALVRLDVAMNTDRVLQLRPSASRSARRSAILRLFGFIGTRFDHHFSADEHETIFCTELVQLGMPFIALPKRTAYGRHVIYPDDVANAGIAGSRGLSVITYLRADRQGWEEAGPRIAASDIASSR